MSQLYLIGYRTTGKTSLAPLVAARLGRKSIDLDQRIMQVARRTVAEIWQTLGEPYFRTQESILLSELSGLAPSVIATGGGVVLDEGNRQIIRQTGIAIWLRATPETIRQRIAADAASSDTRPSLGDSIESTLAARAPLYRELASGSLDTENRTLDQLADQIVEIFNEVNG